MRPFYFLSCQSIILQAKHTWSDRGQKDSQLLLIWTAFDETFNIFTRTTQFLTHHTLRTGEFDDCYLAPS